MAFCNGLVWRKGYYASPEHAMACMKAEFFELGDDVVQEVMMQRLPHEARAVLRQYVCEPLAPWLQELKKHLPSLVLAMAKADPRVREEILATGDRYVLAATDRDNVLGAGVALNSPDLFDRRAHKGTGTNFHD